MARHASPIEQSPSPAPQPPTKRDVRRNRIMDKLQSMIDGFSSNQHAHYRAQLQALQVDMTLVLRADPYPSGGGEWTGVLEDRGDEIKSLVEQTGASLPNDEAAQKDFQALAGSWYREFAREVNDCIEKRDAELTALHVSISPFLPCKQCLNKFLCSRSNLQNHYTASVAELERLTQFKLRQAEEEHKALTSTIRSRLVQTISRKRQQLLRDKEQLDIADSNALLLHPNHFSINNPGSPPNGLNRKTRHLRHRQGSPNPGDLEGNGKKKRKAAALEEDGNESPAPNMRPQHTEALGSRSPFREAREKNVYTQYEAPAYSLERIFTEKELAMATDTAKIATWRYFNQPQEHQQQEQESNGVVTAVPSITDEIMEGAEEEDVVVVAPTTEDADGTPPPSEAAAPEMERSFSHQVLTRGGARANPLAALNDLAAVATSERAAAGGMGLTTSKDPFAPVVPSYHAVTRSEKSGAPAPSGVSHLDMDNDFAMMRQTASRNAAASNDPEELPTASAHVNDEDEETAARMRRELLDQALGESGVSQPYRLPLLETGPALIGKGVERIPGTGFAPVLSFEQKIRQQVAPPPPGAGGAMAAALHGKGLGGGEPMSRTTSAGGVSEMGEGGSGPVTGRRERGRQMV